MLQIASLVVGAALVLGDIQGFKLHVSNSAPYEEPLSKEASWEQLLLRCGAVFASTPLMIEWLPDENSKRDVWKKLFGKADYSDRHNAVSGAMQVHAMLLAFGATGLDALVEEQPAAVEQYRRMSNAIIESASRYGATFLFERNVLLSEAYEEALIWSDIQLCGQFEPRAMVEFDRIFEAAKQRRLDRHKNRANQH